MRIPSGKNESLYNRNPIRRNVSNLERKSARTNESITPRKPNCDNVSA